MKEKEKGIAIISLVVTISVLIILAMVTITEVGKNQKETEKQVIESELVMVQNAVLQRKTSANIEQINYDELPGENIAVTEVKEIVGDISLKGNEGEYKILNEGALRELGITNTTDTYIVNYKTGEVINKDKFDFSEEKKMYITATD